MHDGRVIATTEGLTNLGQAEISELPAEVHSDLARGDQHTRATLAAQLLDSDPEVRGGSRHDLSGRDLRATFGWEEVLQNDLSDGKVDRLPIK